MARMIKCPYDRCSESQHPFGSPELQKCIEKENSRKAFFRDVARSARESANESPLDTLMRLADERRLKGKGNDDSQPSP